MADYFPQELTNDEIIQRNVDLSFAFNRYIFDHPQVLDQLPGEFRLVILPQSDPALSMHNLKMLNQWRERDKPVVLVLMQDGWETAGVSVRPDVFLPVTA